MSTRSGGRARAVLFDWGDTLMKVFPGSVGAMADWPEVAVLPGVRRALTALRPLATLGVATNAKDSQAVDIRRALRRVRLSSLLPRLYCCRSLGHLKSSPEFWSAVLADLGVRPEQVVMVGDDPVADVEEPVRCGLKVVWLNAGSPRELVGERVRTVHEMASLPGVLREAGWL
jgi:HAD superfamily hydrolase (TIGR01509 family)